MSPVGLTNTSFGHILYNLLAAIFGLANAELTLQETGGTLTATGAVQTLYIENAPLGCLEPRVLFVDLDNMDTGDTTVFRVLYRIAAAGGLQLFDYQSFSGIDGGLTNSRKLVAIELLPNRFGFQITLQQTAGTNRAYTWSILEEA